METDTYDPHCSPRHTDQPPTDALLDTLKGDQPDDKSTPRLLVKIVMLKDVPQMIESGKVPLQPDDMLYQGICLYKRGQVTPALAEYFGVMPTATREEILLSVRVYHVSYRSVIKRPSSWLDAHDDMYVLRVDDGDMLEVRYLKSSIVW